MDPEPPRSFNAVRSPREIHEVSEGYTENRELLAVPVYDFSDVRASFLPGIFN